MAGATLLGLAMFATLFLGTILAVFLTLGAVRGDAERGPAAAAARAAGLARARCCSAATPPPRRSAPAYVIAVFLAATVITRVDRRLVAGPRRRARARARARRSPSSRRCRWPARSFLSATANGIAVFMVFGAGPGRRAARPDRRGARLGHAAERRRRRELGCCRSRRLYQAALARPDRRHGRLHAAGDRPRPVRRRAVRPASGCGCGRSCTSGSSGRGLCEASPGETYEAPVRPGRRLHRHPVRRQPGGGGARRRRPRHRGDAALRELDEPVGDDVRAAAGGRAAPTTASASSRRSPSCRSPATRRSAPATPGSRAASTTGDDRSCRSAPPASSPSAARPSGLAFAAPPLIRSGPVEEALIGEIAGALGISRAEIVDAQWADNGPGWVAVLLENAEAVLAHPPELHRARHRRRRPASGRRARGDRGARVLPQGRLDRRGPGDRQPQRLAGRVAARHGRG